VGPGQGISQVYDFAVFQDQKIYFTGQSATDGFGLFQTDGTPSIMNSISVGFDSVGDVAMRGSDIFFVADDGVRGKELWMSSGPGSGSTLVADIEADAGDSDPDHLTLMGSAIIFTAERQDVGRELWYTLGAAGITTLVADINPGDSDSYPWSLAVHGEFLYFTADDGTHGFEPFVTNLLVAPAILADINSVGGSNPWHYKEYMGNVYFYAQDAPHGTELWVTDGTGPGTQMVFDLNPDGDGGWPD
jgi:ELWxxDGT repeat protein